MGGSHIICTWEHTSLACYPRVQGSQEGSPHLWTYKIGQPEPVQSFPDFWTQSSVPQSQDDELSLSPRPLGGAGQSCSSHPPSRPSNFGGPRTPGGEQGWLVHRGGSGREGPHSLSHLFTSKEFLRPQDSGTEDALLSFLN